MPSKRDNFTILQDTRENHPWKFEPQPYFDVKVQKLDTGDYTVQGYEDILCIERKATSNEVAINVCEMRFQKEIDRMLNFKQKFIVCEFSYNTLLKYPYESGIPANRILEVKINVNYILKMLFEYQIRGIHVLFCDNPKNAANAAFNIMKRVIENKNNV